MKHEPPPPARRSPRRPIRLTDDEARMLKGKSEAQRSEWLRAMPLGEYMRRVSEAEIEIEERAKQTANAPEAAP